MFFEWPKKLQKYLKYSAILANIAPKSHKNNTFLRVFPKFFGKLWGKFLKDMLSVGCAFCALLFMFDNTLADEPVAFDHGKVDGGVCPLASGSKYVPYVAIENGGGYVGGRKMFH